MSISKSRNSSSMLVEKSRGSGIDANGLITIHERGDGYDQYKFSVATAASYGSQLGSQEEMLSEDDSQYTASVTVQDDLEDADNLSEKTVSVELTPSELLIMDKHTLSPLVKFCFISTLEETIYQLEVLKHLLPRANKDDDGYYQSLEARYEPIGVRKLMFPDEGPTPSETKLMKVNRDRALVTTILKRANDELLESFTFYTLAAAIEADRQMKEDDETLENECATNEQIIRDFKKEMKAIVKMVADSEYNDTVLFKFREGELHDTVVTSEMEKRFVSNWETSRRFLAKCKTDNAENALKSTLEETHIGIEREYRVNVEIETYINMSKQQLEDSIESWMERYDREVEEKDQEILRLRIERELNMRNLTELQETFDRHKEELDEYKAIQEEIRLRLEREAFLNKMATRIQAWWRGLMVRRCLGPFRKKKKKRGKKDKMRAKGSALELIERNQKLKRRQHGRVRRT